MLHSVVEFCNLRLCGKGKRGNDNNVEQNDFSGEGKVFFPLCISATRRHRFIFEASSWRSVVKILKPQRSPDPRGGAKQKGG